MSRDLRFLAEYSQWDVKDKTRDEARKMRNLRGDSVGGMVDENSNDDDCSSNDDSSNDEYDSSLEDKEKKPSAKTAKSSKSTFKTVTNSRGKGKTDKSIIFSSDDEADTPKPATGIRTGGRPSTRQEKARPQKKTSSKSSAKPRVKSSEDGDTSPLVARARARPRVNYAHIENRHASELEADDADQRKNKPGLGKLNFNDNASDASAGEEAQVESSSSEASEEEDYEEEESSVSDSS